MIEMAKKFYKVVIWPVVETLYLLLAGLLPGNGIKLDAGQVFKMVGYFLLALLVAGGVYAILV